MFFHLLTTAMIAISFPYTLSDFSKNASFDHWRIVNDGVMGGLSEGQFIPTKDGHAVFKGSVSLKNNGGFTSVRCGMNDLNISGASSVKIKLKGDKKNYQFRVKESQGDRHAYKYEFETSGKWEEIHIPIKEMTPTFRGRRPDLPNFQAEQLDEIGFLIANKKNESFELEIASIVLE